MTNSLTSLPKGGIAARIGLRREDRALRVHASPQRSVPFEQAANLSAIVLPFTAGGVNLLIQPGPSASAAVTVLLDGTPLGDAHGADVGEDGAACFDRSGMIRLVAGASRRRHVLTLVMSDPGVRAFAFTTSAKATTKNRE